MTEISPIDNIQELLTNIHMLFNDACHNFTTLKSTNDELASQLSEILQMIAKNSQINASTCVANPIVYKEDVTYLQNIVGSLVGLTNFTDVSAKIKNQEELHENFSNLIAYIVTQFWIQPKHGPVAIKGINADRDYLWVIMLARYLLEHATAYLQQDSKKASNRLHWEAVQSFKFIANAVPAPILYGVQTTALSSFFMGLNTEIQAIIDKAISNSPDLNENSIIFATIERLFFMFCSVEPSTGKVIEAPRYAENTRVEKSKFLNGLMCPNTFVAVSKDIQAGRSLICIEDTKTNELYAPAEFFGSIAQLVGLAITKGCRVILYENDIFIPVQWFQEYVRNEYEYPHELGTQKILEALLGSM